MDDLMKDIKRDGDLIYKLNDDGTNLFMIRLEAGHEDEKPEIKKTSPLVIEKVAKNIMSISDLKYHLRTVMEQYEKVRIAEQYPTAKSRSILEAEAFLNTLE